MTVLCVQGCLMFIEVIITIIYIIKEILVQSDVLL